MDQRKGARQPAREREPALVTAIRTEIALRTESHAEVTSTNTDSADNQAVGTAAPVVGARPSGAYRRRPVSTCAIGHTETMAESGCLACEVNRGRISPPGGPVHVDDLWQADHELTPLLSGYVILKPRRHVHQLADLTDAEASALGPLLRRLLGAMQAVLAPERIYVASFAETVHHLHFHLVPRYSDMPGLGPDLLPDIFAGRWSCGRQEAVDAAARIRHALVG